MPDPTNPETPTKPWWQSTTILGGAVVIVVEVVRQLTTVDIGKENASAVIFGVVGAIGGAVAIIGRLKAQHVLTK